MKTIAIYADAGADGEGVLHLLENFKAFLDPKRYFLRLLTGSEIQKGEWKKDTAVFVMPGGRDLFYLRALQQRGMEEICSFVREGGKYLGICAGAYFASSMIEFEKGGPLEVCGDRFLRFFPGIAKGPAYGPNAYEIGTRKGAKAALVSYGQKHCYLYYNGGCFFHLVEQFKEVEVLARYADIQNAPAAVIRCSFGKGSALLSGVHFEFSTPYLKRFGSLKPGEASEVFSLVEKDEEARRLFFHSLILNEI